MTTIYKTFEADIEITADDIANLSDKEIEDLLEILKTEKEVRATLKSNKERLAKALSK